MMKYLLISLVVFSCNTVDLNMPGAIVPPTVDQDPNLPQLKVFVAGHERTLHLQTFGDSANPPILVLHGGPGGDFRLLLPLKELADEYFLVMWDSRGAGLSERVTKDELTIDSFDEEIEQVKAVFAPNQKVTLIGHSFGSAVMARYTGRHLNEVKQLILIEPDKLDFSVAGKSNGGAITFLDGQDFFWQNEILTSSDHAAADYKAIDLLPKSARNWTCDRSIVTHYPFWRFGAYHYHILLQRFGDLPKNFNWGQGLDEFSGKITIVAGTCGALSASFQLEVNLPAFPMAGFSFINGAGHLSLFTDFKSETVETLRTTLSN